MKQMPMVEGSGRLNYWPEKNGDYRMKKTISIRFNEEELSLIKMARERLKTPYEVSRHMFLKTLILRHLFEAGPHSVDASGSGA